MSHLAYIGLGGNLGEPAAQIHAAVAGLKAHPALRGVDLSPLYHSAPVGFLAQPRFTARSGKRPHRLIEQPRFRAAYDFLLLRAETGEVPTELADWWTEFQDVDESGRDAMVTQAQRQAPAAGEVAAPRRKRRRKPRASPAAK